MIWSAADYAAMKAGITKRVSQQVLRHSWATQQLKAGMDLKILQVLLRPDNLETTSAPVPRNIWKVLRSFLITSARQSWPRSPAHGCSRNRIESAHLEVADIVREHRKRHLRQNESCLSFQQLRVLTADRD